MYKHIQWTRYIYKTRKKERKKKKGKKENTVVPLMKDHLNEQSS